MSEVQICETFAIQYPLKKVEVVILLLYTLVKMCVLLLVKIGDIWFECNDMKITKIEFNHFCNSNTVYKLFYKRST